MGRDAIAIVPAALVRHRNNDVEYDYRQDSDFHYLTGFAEPEAVAVLIPGRPAGEYVLFCRDRDPTREMWDGGRAGPDGAVRRFGADLGGRLLGHPRGRALAPSEGQTNDKQHGCQPPALSPPGPARWQHSPPLQSTRRPTLSASSSV